MHTVIQLLFLLLLFYFFAYIARLIFSIFKFRQNKFTEILCKITDPVIDFFKTNFPVKLGPYEISSILPLIAMYLILKFLSDITNGTDIININYLLHFVFYMIHALFNIFMLTAIVCIILIMLTNNRVFQMNNSLIAYARTVIDPVIAFMKKNIKLKFLNSDNRYYILLLIFLISVMIVGGMILQFFVDYFYSVVSGKNRIEK